MPQPGGMRAGTIPAGRRGAALLAAVALAAAGIAAVVAVAPAGMHAAYAQSAEPTVAIGALMSEPGQEFDDANRTRVLQYAVDRFNEQSAGFDLALNVTMIARGGEPAGLVEAYGGGAGPLFYVGPTTSEGIANIRANATSMGVLDGIVLVSPSSEAPQLAIAGDRIFRLALNIERQGGILVGEMEAAGIDSLITVARDDAWGRQLAEYVRSAAAGRGMSNSAQILFSDSTDAAYWRGIAGQVEGNATGPDTGVFFAGYGESYPSMAAAAANSTALAGTTWFAPSTALVASSPIPAGPVRNFSAAVGLTVLGENVPESGLTRAIDSHLGAAAPVSFYEYSTYDSVFVLGGAIAAAGGPSADAASVAAALPAAALNYTGALGDILLDRNGDLRSPDSFTVWRADRATGELAEAGTTATPLTRIGALMALGYQDWPDDLTLDGLRLAAADYNDGEDASLVKLIAYNITGRDVLEVLRAAHAGGDGPVAYVGPSLSSNLARVAAYAGSAGIVLFSTGSEAESLSIPGDTIFRMAVSTDRQAAYMGQTMADREGIESVVTLVRDDEWGRSLNATLAETLALRGVGVNATVPFEAGGTANWTRVAEQASSALAGNRSATLVAFVGLINDLDGLANAAAALDPAGRAALTGVEWFVTTSTVSSVGFPMIQDPATAAFASETNMTAIDNDVVWENPLRVYFEGRVPNTWFYEFAAYDTLFVLAGAAKSNVESGLENTAAALAAAIPAAAEAHVGILGDIALNANGDLLTPDRFGIWHVVDGNWTDTGVRKFTPVVDVGVLAALGDRDYPDDLTERAVRQAVDDYNNAGPRQVFANLVVHNITGRDVLDVLRGAHAGGDGPIVYVGPTLSSNLAMIAWYAASNDIVLFSPASEAQSLAVEGDNIFRMTISSGRQGALIGEVMADAGVVSAVTVVRDDEWGRSLNASIAGALSARGAAVAGSVPFAAGGTFNWTSADGVAAVSSAISSAVSAAQNGSGGAPAAAASVGVAFIGVENDQNALAAAWAAAAAAPGGNATGAAPGGNATAAALTSVPWFVTPSGISSSPRIPDEAARSFATAARMTGIAIDVGNSAARAALDAAVPGLAFYEYAAYDTLRVVGEALNSTAAPGRNHTSAALAAAIPAAAEAYVGVLGDIELDRNGDLLAPNRFAVWRVVDGTWTDTGVTRPAPALGGSGLPPSGGGNGTLGGPDPGCVGDGIVCITLGELYLPEADALAPRINGEVHAAYALAVADWNREKEAENSTLRLRLELVNLTFASPADGVAAAYDGGGGIVAYLGPTFSSVAAQLGQYTADSRTVMVSPTSQATSQPSHVRDDGLFRLSLNDNYEADQLAIAAHREGVAAVVPVVITAYGTSYEEEIRRESEALGMAVFDTVHIPYPNQDQSPTVAEINARVAAIRQSGIDLSAVGLLVVSFNQELHDIAHLAVEYPLLTQVKWFEPGHLFPPQPIDDAETLRLAQAAPFHSISWDLPQTPRLDRVDRALAAAGGGVPPQHYAYSAYDSVYLLADAIIRSMDADGNYTGAGVAAQMHAAAEGLDVLLGDDLRLDANGDRISPSRVVIWRSEQGTGAWVDTGDRARLDPVCSVSLGVAELAFGSVAAGERSAVMTQTIRNTGTEPLGTLTISATGWVNAGGSEVLPGGATSVMVGDGGEWTQLDSPLGAAPGAEQTLAKFRLDAPSSMPQSAAGPASQSVTYTASCGMP